MRSITHILRFLVSALFSVPWYVVVLISEAACFTGMWILPAVFYSPGSHTPPPAIWLVIPWGLAGVFLLLGLLILTAQKFQRLQAGHDARLQRTQ